MLVLPILGDNDLSDEHLLSLRHWRDTRSLAGRRILSPSRAIVMYRMNSYPHTTPSTSSCASCSIFSVG
ncbi:hypothetical protein NWF32_23055 [Pseudomonas qingdaonensis]|nr:hypothetical protein [Pseudomonas qingdaonensis]